MLPDISISERQFGEKQLRTDSGKWTNLTAVSVIGGVAVPLTVPNREGAFGAVSCSALKRLHLFDKIN